VDAHVSDTANIAPSKIRGTAWTSTNDGSGSGLDADTVDGIHASGLPQVRDYGLLQDPATSHTLTFPHYRPFTIELASGLPAEGGLASITGYENDDCVAIVYTKYNGDGTSASGGAKCCLSTTDTILTFGSGDHLYYLDCPGDVLGAHQLTFRKAATAVEGRYRITW
jgi:hypothetical protein